MNKSDFYAAAAAESVSKPLEVSYQAWFAVVEHGMGDPAEVSSLAVHAPHSDIHARYPWGQHSTRDVFWGRPSKRAVTIRPFQVSGEWWVATHLLHDQRLHQSYLHRKFRNTRHLLPSVNNRPRTHVS